MVVSPSSFAAASSGDRPSARTAGRSFATSVARLHELLERDGVAFADMRRAESLELQLAGVPNLGQGGATRVAAIERLEGPVVARSVAAVPPSASRLRYFLDGTQRTFPVWRFGLIPVTATVAAAAILVRDEAGNPQIMPGTLRLSHALLVPTRVDHPAIDRLLRAVSTTSIDVVDPLDEIENDEEYAAIAADYGKVVEFAYVRARKVRETLEKELLQEWARDEAGGADEGWIVVDGRLRVAAPRALGLVKQFTDRHLDGPEAEVLLGLAPGHRTSAFRLANERRSIADPFDEEGTAYRDELTLWYLRLWDAAGLDARHALIRVEACSDVGTTEQIDDVSSWLMAERTPRATADARWATLLYPVHYLERILKRRLEADTRGWPGGG